MRRDSCQYLWRKVPGRLELLPASAHVPTFSVIENPACRRSRAAAGGIFVCLNEPQGESGSTEHAGRVLPRALCVSFCSREKNPIYVFCRCYSFPKILIVLDSRTKYLQTYKKTAGFFKLLQKLPCKVLSYLYCHESSNPCEADAVRRCAMYVSRMLDAEEKVSLRWTA